MKIYAFDVDETLEVSNGPVTIQMMKDLRLEGHIIGLCGNLNAFCTKVPDWYNIISFTTNFDTGPYLGGLIPKNVWLHCFQHTTFPGAEEYILVGNVLGEKNSLGFTCGSADSVAAEAAGWRFIKEDLFAEGHR